MLDRLPDVLDPPHGLVRQRAGLQALHRLRQLLERARADDDGVAELAPQRRVVRHPPVRQVRPRTPGLRRHRLPLAQRLEVGRLRVHVAVHAAEHVAEAAGAVGDLLARLDQEAARDGRVGVEGDAEPAQGRQEEGLGLARHRRVVALVDGRQDVAVGLAVRVHGLDVRRLVVGQAEAREGALFVDLVDAGEGLGKGHARVGRVHVEDVDL